jgi:hypothetical protein
MKKRISAVLAAIMIIASVPCSAEKADTSKTDTYTPVQTVNDTVDTISAVGSVSKVFCTVAAMQLHEQGLLDLDAPVVDYIPEFRMKDERYKDITVRMLMQSITTAFLKISAEQD